MSAPNLKVDDLCWAKMKGFCHWPAKIVEPPKGSNKKASHYVNFFGTNDHAWIPNENILEYETNKEACSMKSKLLTFKNAVKEIAEYSQKMTKKDKPAASSPVSIDVSKTNGVAPKAKPDNGGKRKLIKIKKNAANERPMKIKKLRKSMSDTMDETIFKDNLYDNSSHGAFCDYTSYDSSPRTKAHEILTPSFVERPKTPPLEMDKISEALRRKKIEPSQKNIGFLGLGNMGKGIVKNLLHSGHTVTVWNRTTEKVTEFVKAGAKAGQTPADVVQASDITFCCVTGPRVTKELMFGNCGVLQAIDVNKSYVEMTSIDPDTSQDMAEAVTSRGGKYLEAPLYGSKCAAEEGTLIVLAAGDRTLFQECESCFHSIGQHAYFLGSDVGNGSKMNLILSMFLGTTLASLSEAFALAQKYDLCRENVVEILELGALCDVVLEKGRAMISNEFQTNTPLQHMQKDLNLVLGMADKKSVPLILAASANDMFKRAKMVGYSQHDMGAVCKGILR